MRRTLALIITLITLTGTLACSVESLVARESSGGTRGRRPTPTKTPRPTWTATPDWTATPTNTATPTDTPTPVPPTDTPIPTDTPTPAPTDTPLPTNTPRPVPPTATFTPAPPTATPAPSYPFKLVENVAQPTNNASIYVEGKIYEGDTPLWGYRFKLTNLTTGREYIGAESVAQQEWNCLPSICGGGARIINAKVTDVTSWGDAQWEIHVIDGSGAKVSENFTFQTSASNHQLFYVAFVK